MSKYVVYYVQDSDNKLKILKSKKLMDKFVSNFLNKYNKYDTGNWINLIVEDVHGSILEFRDLYK